MGISSLRRLSLNRNSFIEVKNILFRNDQEKVDCFIRFWDTFAFCYVTLFKVLQFYVEVRDLRLSVGLDVNRHEVLNQEEVLVRVIKFLKKKKDEFLMFHRFHSFHDSVAKFVTPLSMILKEFKDFVEVDLTVGTRNLNRNFMLDMYNCDLSYMKNKIIPSLETIMDHLKKFGAKSSQWDSYLMGVNTMIINDSLLKIKRIIGLNQPLVKSLLNNQISISAFHVNRNEASLKFLQVDATMENMFCGETFFGSQLVTLETFQKMLISDCLTILKKILLLFTSFINTTESSMDFFFNLSNFLEITLRQSLLEYRDIYSNPFEIQEKLRSSTMDLSSSLTVADQLIDEGRKLKEYTHFKFLIERIQNKFKTVKTTFDHIGQVLLETERATELDRTDKFQQRFKIVIDSLSCGILGLDTAIDDFIESLENAFK